jgi:hypothetical protein
MDMNTEEFNYHLATLKESDPEYVVDVLGVTSEELIAAFPRRAANFIEEENG